MSPPALIQIGETASEGVRNARSAFLANPQFAGIIDALPDLALVLNQDRRIVAANRAALESLRGLDGSLEFGQRPGDAAGCTNAASAPDGCGSADACSTCGALKAIRSAMSSGSQHSEECRITSTRAGGKAMDLSVVATPFLAGNTRLVLAVMKDISAEKRRTILERTFLHDVLNTVSGLYGLASSLADEQLSTEEEREQLGWMLRLTRDLTEEIRHHRILMMAERGEFVPEFAQVSLSALMNGLHALYSSHIAAKDRVLVLLPVPEIAITTDVFLLRRVLGNLIKNAIEATPAGGTVTLACERRDREVCFGVHNPGVIPRQVQLQIFQRSFTTKGEHGRGIGTYSVKLFGEKYLHGKVGFVSREPEGTTFTFALPLR